MRIAVDVMGGDHGCGVVIGGVLKALEEDPAHQITSLLLVGNKVEIHAAVSGGGFRDHRVKVVHASEVITMEDKPVEAVRKKKDASIVRAMELVRDDKADGVVSPGNTGGIFAAATFRLGRIKGVDRGGIATVIPTPHNHFVLMDSGANVECKPLHLAQFAVMGSVYFRALFGGGAPRVGVLSNGTEPGKGTELVREAHALCKNLDLNFIGNIEGHDLFAGHVDVVVCDGFVGNIVLKTAESLATAMFGMLKHELKASARRKLGAILAQYAFRAIKKRMDPESHGGAPLLGFHGLIMKVHASSRERAIANAIHISAQNHKHKVNQLIATEIATANERISATVADSKADLPA